MAKTITADPWSVKRTVTLPRAQGGEQNFQFVAINGRTFQVPKGKTVEVPAPVYEALENARIQMESAEDAAEKMRNA